MHTLVIEDDLKTAAFAGEAQWALVKPRAAEGYRCVVVLCGISLDIGIHHSRCRSELH